MNPKTHPSGLSLPISGTSTKSSIVAFRPKNIIAHIKSLLALSFRTEPQTQSQSTNMAFHNLPQEIDRIFSMSPAVSQNPIKQLQELVALFHHNCGKCQRLLPPHNGEDTDLGRHCNRCNALTCGGCGKVTKAKRGAEVSTRGCCEGGSESMRIKSCPGNTMESGPRTRDYFDANRHYQKNL